MAESKISKQRHIETHRVYVMLSGSIPAGQLIYDGSMSFDSVYSDFPHISISIGTDSVNADSQRIGVSWSDLTMQGVKIRARALQAITGVKTYIDVIVVEK